MELLFVLVFATAALRTVTIAGQLITGNHYWPSLAYVKDKAKAPVVIVEPWSLHMGKFVEPLLSLFVLPIATFWAADNKIGNQDLNLLIILIIIIRFAIIIYTALTKREQLPKMAPKVISFSAQGVELLTVQAQPKPQFYAVRLVILSIIPTLYLIYLYLLWRGLI